MLRSLVLKNAVLLASLCGAISRHVTCAGHLQPNVLACVECTLGDAVLKVPHPPTLSLSKHTALSPPQHSPPSVHVLHVAGLIFLAEFNEGVLESEWGGGEATARTKEPRLPLPPPDRRRSPLALGVAGGGAGRWAAAVRTVWRKGAGRMGLSASACTLPNVASQNDLLKVSNIKRRGV